MDDELEKPAAPGMAWLLTFADLVSLMLTFFILLYSMKVIDAKKWESLRGAMNDTFNVQEPIVELKPDQRHSIEKFDPIRADGLFYVRNLLQTRFAANELLKNASLRHDRDRDTLVISLPSQLLFNSGDDTLRAEGAAALAALGDSLRHLDNTIEIAGHTDPNPIATAKFPSNWELSVMRGVRVMETLRAQGVNQNMQVMGFGASRFEDTPTETGLLERYARARRVDIIIHGNKL